MKREDRMLLNEIRERLGLPPVRTMTEQLRAIKARLEKIEQQRDREHEKESGDGI